MSAISSLFCSECIAESIELYWHMSHVFCSGTYDRLKIRFTLFGRGLYFSGIESHVFLHMITAFFLFQILLSQKSGKISDDDVVVICLKNFISFFILHGKSPHFQSQFFSSSASIMIILFFIIRVLFNFKFSSEWFFDISHKFKHGQLERKGRNVYV